MAKRLPACSRDTSAKQKPCITNNYILGCVGEILHTLFCSNGYVSKRVHLNRPEFILFKPLYFQNKISSVFVPCLTIIFFVQFIIYRLQLHTGCSFFHNPIL
jgi:hypothetical protein